MASKNRILTNIFSNWVYLFLNIVVSFFLAPFVVHKLGNVYYGVWVIMMQFTSYLYLMDFGVRETVIRYISKYDAESDGKGPRTKINDILCASVSLYGAIGFLCLIVAGVLAYYFDAIFQIPEDAVEEARWVVIISGATLAQFFQFNAYHGIVMGFQQYAIFNKVGIIVLLIRAATIVTLLSNGYGIVALAVVQLCIGLATNIVIYFIAKRLMASHGVPFNFRFMSYGKHKEEYKNVFNYSFYVLLNNIGQKTIFHSDAIIVGMFMPAATVTFYAIAGTLSDYLVKICSAGVHALTPLSSEVSTKGDKGGLKNIVYMGSKLSLIVSLPIICVYATMGANFIELWMGAEYMELSGNLLVLLALLQLYSLPHHTYSSVMHGMSKHHLIGYVRITEAVFKVVLSIILIQSMGLYGVAVGTMIPHFISVIIVLPLILKKIVGIELFRFYINTYFLPIIGSIPFGVACYYVGTHYPASSLLGFFGIVIALMPVYLLASWFLAFSKSEREMYSRTLRGYLFKK